MKKHVVNPSQNILDKFKIYSAARQVSPMFDIIVARRTIVLRQSRAYRKIWGT